MRSVGHLRPRNPWTEVPDHCQFSVNPGPCPSVSGVMRTLVRGIIGVAAAAAFAVTTAPGASAGGASWDLDQQGYQPGDVAEARTAVNWAHNPSLGTPEDGPYLAYLLPLAADPSVTGVGPAWPSIPPEAWLVGEVAITPGPIEQAPGFVVGPNGATIRFRIPGHLPPGHYSLLHCNVPCTTTLGDITFGMVVILNPDGSTPPQPQLPSPADPPPPDAAPPDTAAPDTAAPTTATPTTAPTTTAAPAISVPTDTSDTPDTPASADGDGGTATAAALGIVVVLGAAAGTVAVRRRGERDGAAPESTAPVD